jgi:poly-beta-1,6-N-acetyl-D-glucosamine biosynthesis protein PgaD
VTELVINAPHLQTSGQRLGAMGLAVFGWLLWSYFFFPLVSLGCWLVDDNICSQWVNMAGGYLNLLEVLRAYTHAVLGMIAAWIAWLSYDYVCSVNRAIASAPVPVTNLELVNTFKLNAVELAACQSARFAIVHYDGAGHIIGLEPVDHALP